MIRKSKTKVALLLMTLVFAGIVTGFFVGIILAGVIAKKKENPVFWKQTVHKQLEKLHPTAEQWKTLDARTDSAVQELVVIRRNALQQVWEVAQHAVADIEKELTPEQRQTFQGLKPKKPAELK